MSTECNHDEYSFITFPESLFCHIGMYCICLPSFIASCLQGICHGINELANYSTGRLSLPLIVCHTPYAGAKINEEKTTNPHPITEVDPMSPIGEL